MLEILYQDDYLIAINKPHDMLVHRSPIAADVEVFALQILRDQIGKRVYPAHRIDRKTGGVLLFAFDKQTETAMQQQFNNGQVHKKYLAVVRGFTPDEQEIDYALKKENGVSQNAFTIYKTLARTEIAVPFGGHATSRYSLIQAEPTTGRMHQLRKHLAHVYHPIIGDRTHGCNKQNKLFKEKWDMTAMLLHASQISFNHPVSEINITITAPLQKTFENAKQLLNL